MKLISIALEVDIQLHPVTFFLQIVFSLLSSKDSKIAIAIGFFEANMSTGKFNTKEYSII